MFTSCMWQNDTGWPAYTSHADAVRMSKRVEHCCACRLHKCSAAYPHAVLVGVLQLVGQRLAVADGWRPPRPLPLRPLLHVPGLWPLPRRLGCSAAVG
jgi:hypothetical protein